MKKNNKVEILLFIILVCVVVPLEVFCARLAFETLGEVTSTLYYLAMGLNVIFVLMALLNRTIAAVGIFVLAIVIIPYQMFLGDRLVRVQAEASRIVSFVYEEKIATGNYPLNLAKYEFHNTDIEPFIQHYSVDENGDRFSLYYRVGTENTSHSYISDIGWGYYPD